MNSLLRIALVAVFLVPFSAAPATAAMIYWNLFNDESNSQTSAGFVTYATLNDMLTDQNRVDIFSPGPLAPNNIVGAGSDGSTYWNIFNDQSNFVGSAGFITYATLNDMFTDQNRVGIFSPGAPSPDDIRGTGSDGSTYWNLFNDEGSSQDSAQFATYATLEDMLNNQNLVGVFSPGAPAADDIVGTGSDGSTYWNLFNDESSSQTAAAYATYATLNDMLNNQNLTGVFTPGTLAPNNIIGTGAFFTPDRPVAVPAPATVWMFLTGLGALGLFRRRFRRAGLR